MPTRPPVHRPFGKRAPVHRPRKDDAGTRAGRTVYESRRWREKVYPLVRDFIDANQRAAVVVNTAKPAPRRSKAA